MLEISNTAVWGLPGAIRGMRNPYKTVDKGDSFYDAGVGRYPLEPDGWQMGEKDHQLAMNLTTAGPDHGKFLRMIHVQMDVKAPLYWWKEADTYKVGTVANSESTMHTITKKKFDLSDFSFDGGMTAFPEMALKVISNLNDMLDIWKITEDEEGKKMYWKAIIQYLPEAYNQTRTLDLNYQVLKAMYHARKNHKLTEWHTFCDWIRDLPYSELITGGPDGLEDRG